MKWIEKLFGKKEQGSEEIRFDELPFWLASGKKRLSERISRNTAFIYSDIEDALSEIKKSTSLLEEAEPEGRFHLKMVKIGTSNRDNMVKQVRLLINNIALPKTADLKTVMEFHENAMQTLNICLENMMKSYQYAKMVFFDETKEVIEDVNALGRLLNQLIEPINSNKKTIEDFESAERALQNIKDMNSQIEPEKRKAEENNEKTSLLKKKIEVDQNCLTRLSESDQCKRYINLRNDIVDLENIAKKTVSEINTLFLPLHKTLTRLKQLNDDGKYVLAPDVKKEINLCLLDPKSVRTEFFIELHQILKKDTTAFTSEKRDKILEQIEYIAANIGALNKQYQDIVSNINSKKNEISEMNIVQEVKDLRRRISALQDNLTSLEKEVEISGKHLKSLEDDIELKKQELQQRVSGIDRKYKVLFNSGSSNI